MELDWNLCIICQQNITEPLKCPLQCPGTSDKTDAYKSFLMNVEQFQAINALPTSIFFGSSETPASFASHAASWHKSCHLKYNNLKLSKAQKRKRSACSTAAECEKRPSSKRHALSIDNCLFCEKGCEDGDLHQVSTFDADINIRTIITELQDTKLLARIDRGDLIAQEIKYHLKCLTNLRNLYRSHKRKSDQQPENTNEKLNESRAFVELTTYIKSTVDSGTVVFKLSEVHSLYVNRLQELGIEKIVNKTRLKNDLLEHFSEAQEQNDGKNTVIVFEKGMHNMLKEALKKRDFSEDAMILAKAATLIRNDIFSHQCFKFTGNFPPGCQEDSLPSSLKSLISLIFNGVNLKDQDRHESQACLTVGQIILYNTRRRPSDPAVKMRHTLLREPPIPVYIGLNIHQQVRSKKLIQQLHQMGISISYARVIELEDWIATSVCEQFKEDGIVAPACLRKGLFTIGALDNIDHDPSSTTSQTSFHGTGISLFQFPTAANSGVNRPGIRISPCGSSQHSLPDSYSFVPAVALITTTINVPNLDRSNTPPVQTCLEEAIVEENGWFNYALPLLEKELLMREDTLVWGAYHASHQPPLQDPPALRALLPLFYEKSATPAMVKHGMDVQKQAIEHLNPGQIPVTCFDQPLFALAKLVQWKWPTTHGESLYVVMLGGLHTEMALWNTLGDILEGSGWTTALTEAEVASSGIAASFLKSAHLNRTRHAHQVTLLALQKLQQEAFMQSGCSEGGEVWVSNMCERSPTFMYWDLIMRFETLILIFVRAHREGNFPLYVEVLEKLVPLFFALDHVNYSRWLPVHIRDMKMLPKSIKEEFANECHWVLSKTNNTFSTIPVDQAHEQENAYVKGSGGCIGLTENPVAFRRWMLSGPELVRVQQQFEDQYLPDSDPENPKNFQNHEQGLAAQRRFQQQVCSLYKTVLTMGNPFLDDFPELITLDSRDCVDKSVIVGLRSLEDTGIKQYKEYVKNVLEDCSCSIHSPIKKNSLPLLKRPQPKTASKHGRKVRILQNNVALFSQLYISMQSRESDLKEFFAHEIQSFPPSLSELGKLNLPSAKSELLQCIEQSVENEPPAMFDCMVLDGPVIIHSLPTSGVTTFNEYADKVFMPYLMKQLGNTTRLDIVWDTYIVDSLKESTRTKRGKGVRRKVSGSTKLPGNWKDFLRDSKNKEELFTFLTVKVAEYIFPPSKFVYITSGKSVVCIGSSNPMLDCNHEEADTRIIVHVSHALQTSMQTIKVRTVDTDVVTILIGAFYDLTAIQPQADIWVAFGMGKNYCFYSINTICCTLGEPRSRSLPVFHALTGCDTTSAFKGKGKKTAWQAWQIYEAVTDTFVHLASHAFEHLSVECLHFQRIERLTVIIYDRTSPLSSVNQARE